MNIVSYEEQIYLLGYWLRTNLLNFKVDRDFIAKELEEEFGVEDAKVIDDIMTMFREGGNLED